MYEQIVIVVANKKNFCASVNTDVDSLCGRLAKILSLSGLKILSARLIIHHHSLHEYMSSCGFVRFWVFNDLMSLELCEARMP